MRTNVFCMVTYKGANMGETAITITIHNKNPQSIRKIEKCDHIFKEFNVQIDIF